MMPISLEHIPTFIWILLGTFTLISSLLAISTLANAIRLRNKRLSWRAGRIKGYPLFSTLFLGSMAVFLIAGLALHSMVGVAMASGYLLLASGWFTTSYFASKRYLTDHGIVKNVNDPSQTIAWHQIRDFVEQKSPEGSHFVFIYSESPMDVEKMIRLELMVPENKLRSFKKIISHKLGRRISCYETESIRVSQFD